jgi:hypothetical protein
MERRTPIFIIASPRPRVGKTLLARLLADFFRVDDHAIAAFDVNPDEFALVDYLPAYTAVSTITDTKGQMALFDELLVADQVPKIVDLGHGLFEKFFGVIEDIGFAKEARRKSIVPVVLYLADADRRSRQGYDMLHDRFPQLALVPVFNEALPAAARLRENFPAMRAGGGTLIFPALAAVLKGVIERPSFSFAAMGVTAADTTNELYLWTRRVFLQFRELELRLLLEELKPTLQSRIYAPLS